VFRKLRTRLRRGRVDVGRYEAPEPTEPPPVEEIAEEGVLIAASAVRMAVKNRQIVRALRDRDDYSEKAAVSAAREVFRALAREKREDVERLDDIIEHTRDRPGRATHQTDYRKADADNLDRREQAKLARRPEFEDPAAYRAARARRLKEFIAVDLPLLEASVKPEY
jgi:hypothetical protein